MITIPKPALSVAARQIGRPKVYWSDYWDDTTNLALTHLGDTEGAAKVVDNEEFEEFTLPEVSGGAPIEVDLKGAKPVATIPLFLADPADRGKLTPLGLSGGAGFSGRRRVKYRTLVLFPDALFGEGADDGGELQLVYDKATTAWKIKIGAAAPAALTAEQQRLLDLSVFIWKCFVKKPAITFDDANGRKALDTVEFVVCQDFTKPEGEMLYTRGDPADVGIDIHPAA